MNAAELFVVHSKKKKGEIAEVSERGGSSLEVQTSVTGGETQTGEKTR